jgi:hypothetical protein
LELHIPLWPRPGPSRPKGLPKAPQDTPERAKAIQRMTKGSPRRPPWVPQAPQDAPKRAKASKGQRKGAQGVPKEAKRSPRPKIILKLPINRTSGRYVNTQTQTFIFSKYSSMRVLMCIIIFLYEPIVLLCSVSGWWQGAPRVACTYATLGAPPKQQIWKKE